MILRNIAATTDLRIVAVTMNGFDEDIKTMIFKIPNIGNIPAVVIQSANPGPPLLDYYPKIYNFVYTNMWTNLCFYFNLRRVPVTMFNSEIHHLEFQYPGTNIKVATGAINNVGYERF
jgi:hypothetical protein